MSLTIQNIQDRLAVSLGPHASGILTQLATECFLPLLVNDPDKYFELAAALRAKTEIDGKFDPKIVDQIDGLALRDPAAELFTDDAVSLIRTMAHPTTLPASSAPLTVGMAAATAPLTVASAPSGITKLHSNLVNVLYDRVYGEIAHSFLALMEGKTNYQLLEFLRTVKNAAVALPDSALVTPVPAGTTEKDILAAKVPDTTAYRAGPYWFNKVFPIKANFQMSHDKTTCIKVGKEFKTVSMDVATETEVADIQAVIDGLGAAHGGRKIQYCDTPGLNDVKRMMLCLFTLEKNAHNQWVFRNRVGATRVVWERYFRNEVLDDRAQLEKAFLGISTIEALNLQWDLELYDHRHTKYARLFGAVKAWKAEALKSYAADVLNVLAPDTEGVVAADPSGGGPPPPRKTKIVATPSDDYATIMSRRNIQDENRKYRNTAAGTDVYHHNATLYGNCHESSELAARIIPVIERLKRYFPAKYDVHIDSQDGSDTIQQYFSGLTPAVATVNRTAGGKYSDLNEKDPLKPETVYIGDWNDNPVKDHHAGVFALLKHPALKNVRTVLLRCDPKKMVYSRHAKWVATLTEALEGTGFDRFAWLNSGRMHTPQFYVMFTREDVALMRDFPQQFRNNIVPEVCTIADYCEMLVQSAYKVGLRPDMTQFLLDLQAHYPKMELGIPKGKTGVQKLYTYLGKCKAATASGFDTQVTAVTVDGSIKLDDY